MLNVISASPQGKSLANLPPATHTNSARPYEKKIVTRKQAEPITRETRKKRKGPPKHRGGTQRGNEEGRTKVTDIHQNWVNKRLRKRASRDQKHIAAIKNMSLKQTLAWCSTCRRSAHSRTGNTSRQTSSSLRLNTSREELDYLMSKPIPRPYQSVTKSIFPQVQMGPRFLELIHAPTGASHCT